MSSHKHRRKQVTCGALTSRKLAMSSDAAERLYWRIYMASDNYGTMSGDPFDVAGACVPNVAGWSERKAAKALAELAQAGLVVVWANESGAWVHILGHDSHQTSDFLRKRGKRHTPMPPESDNPTVSCGGLPLARVLTSSGATELQLQPLTGSTSPKGEESSDELDPSVFDGQLRNERGAQIREVFNHWKTVFGKTDRAKLSPDRRKKINARLSEGYTVEDLKTAIVGFSRSTFHMEGGHTDIPTILRDGSQVEKGVEFAGKPPPASGTAVGTQPRHHVTEDYDDGIVWNDNRDAEPADGGRSSAA